MQSVLARARALQCQGTPDRPPRHKAVRCLPQARVQHHAACLPSAPGSMRRTAHRRAAGRAAPTDVLTRVRPAGTDVTDAHARPSDAAASPARQASAAGAGEPLLVPGRAGRKNARCPLTPQLLQFPLASAAALAMAANKQRVSPGSEIAAASAREEKEEEGHGNTTVSVLRAAVSNAAPVRVAHFHS